MHIVPLIGVLAAGALAAITPAVAFAPGPSSLAATYHASAAASDKAAPLVAVKWKWKKQPPGWGRRHCPPGHWKKGWC